MSMDLEEQYDKIYRYCYFRLKRRETAEDITQETFLRFLESKTYRQTGHALQYLYTIARNLCIDEYRRLAASPPAAGDSPETLTEQPDSRASAGLVEEQLLQRLSLQAALEELTPEEREMLLLRYVNELPVSVLSELFRLSRFAVHRRTTNALNKLKKHLRKEDFL